MSKQSEAEPQFSQVHRLIIGDALTVLRSLADESVDLCVTSSPYYGLRDYGANCSTVWGGVETCEQCGAELCEFGHCHECEGGIHSEFEENDYDQQLQQQREKESVTV